MIADADRRKLGRILEVTTQIEDCVRRNRITEERLLEDHDVLYRRSPILLLPIQSALS